MCIRDRLNVLSIEINVLSQKSSGTISLINFKINIMLTTTTTTTSFVGEDTVILQMSKEFFTFLTSLLTDEKDIDNRF